MVARYRIIRRLGAGGMGEVYLAHDPSLNRQVAIKVLTSALPRDESAKSRLVREAQAAAVLDHPNVCAIYEVGEHEGHPFIAMQFIDGETLATRLARGPLPLQAALDVAEQVTDALAEAHARGIVHRDVKPQNIMLSARGQAKVVDFGLAKIEAGETSADGDRKTMLLTEPGVIQGTTAYMSPEQLRGERLDARTDVFSLGCVLHELAAGLQPPAPQELQRMIGKCLERDRERRYQSAREVLVDFRNLKRDLGAASDRATHIVARRSPPTAKYLATGALLVALAAAVGWLALKRNGPPGPRSIQALAILPFATADADAEYLGDGISDSLINSLSQLPQLKVIARTTAFRYKNAAVDARAVRRELGVDAILTGRVIQQGDSLVVQADLTNATDGNQIWGQRYNRKLVELFSVQEEIAREIAANLRLQLSGREAEGLSKRDTANVDAYRNYVVGRQFAQRRTPPDLQKAVVYYEQAIARDANYALAYAGKADAFTNLSARGYLPLDQGHRKAQEAARKALELAPDLAEAHAAVGQMRVFVAPYDFADGDRALRRAIALSPSWAIARQYLGTSLLEQGRLDEGLKELEAARDLDPLSGFIASLVAYAHFLKRDYPLALVLHRQASSLGPGFSTHQEIEIYVQNGVLPDALAEIDRLRPSRPDDPYLLYGKAILAASTGRRDEALDIAGQLERTPAFGHLAARIHLVLGNHQQAFDLMNHALDAGGIPVFYKDSPWWDPVRRDARFVELLRRMAVQPL